MLTISSLSHLANLKALKANLPANSPALAIYEAGPGYQLSGLNGAVVSRADQVIQETMQKSVGGTTALMDSIASAAQLGYGPYNYFTWGSGPYWTAARRASEGGGFYRVADFLKQTHELLGRSRIYSSLPFIDRKQQQAIINTAGVFLRNEPVPTASVFHFESLAYPGRHGLLFINRAMNRDAFGVGHPDYIANQTGAASFRYHTGFPSTATPFKVLRNEGNFRHHDAYKIGERPALVAGVIDGRVADPLCVDLTVTPEDFTASNVQIRELTLLGGNCRFEIYNV